MSQSTKIPHNKDAEDAVLGSLLIDGDYIHQLTLLPEDFFLDINQFIYSACIELKERSVGINQITVAHELNQKEKLGITGGAAYLSQLTANCTSPLDCLYYADIVNKLSIYRRMIQVGENIQKIAMSQPADVMDSVNKADDLLLTLRKNGVSSAVVSPEERASLMTERYERLLQLDEVSISTGLKDLDDILGGGMFRGEMVIVGARPGMGKTSFLMNVANRVSENHNVLVCSAEMPVEAITDRDIAGSLGVPTGLIRNGNYQDDLYSRIIGEGMDCVKNRHVYFYHDAPLTTSKIMQSGINVQLRHGLDFIVVDYLGLLDDDYGTSQYERIGHMSRKLKQISMKLNVPILVATQLNRALEKRDDKRPQLFDLRDSGRIEEDADVVLFLYRESYYNDVDDNITEILVAKQRQGDANKAVKVFFNKSAQTYHCLVRQ